MTLIAPAANAVITQNDPSLAGRCSPDATTRGYGYVIDFSWNLPPDLTHVKRYELVLQHDTTGIPIVFNATSFQYLACNAFVIDNNLFNWHWQVSALNNGKKVIAVSAPSPFFSFALCRLASNALCNAP